MVEHPCANMAPLNMYTQQLEEKCDLIMAFHRYSFFLLFFINDVVMSGRSNCEKSNGLLL